MVSDIFRRIPYAQARDVFDHLHRRAYSLGIVPDLTELVIVSNPEEILSENERFPVDTGLENRQLFATIKLMSLPVRYVLRMGYSFNWVNGEIYEYARGQEPWIRQATDRLRQHLGKEPTQVERADNYSLNGGVQYFLYNLIKRWDKAVKLHGIVPVPVDHSPMIRQLALFVPKDFPSAVPQAA
jgi:hypothetical protein